MQYCFLGFLNFNTLSCVIPEAFKKKKISGVQKPQTTVIS